MGIPSGYTSAQVVQAVPSPFVSSVTSYTPTVGVWTLGNGSVEGRYVKIGDLVNVFGQVVFGSTSVFTAAQPTITLPFTAKASGDIAPLVSIMYYDASANLRYYGPGITGAGILYPITAITTGTYLTNGNNVGNTVPFTWAVDDFIQFNFTYQVA